MEKSEKIIRNEYTELVHFLIENNISITTMESATGGMIASLLTDTEGASSIVKGAFVTYSNEAKIKQGVPAETIRKFGVYSKETALAMAKAAKDAYQAEIGIGITGSFSNPDPANPDSVPGRIFFAIHSRNAEKICEYELPSYPDRYHYKLHTAGLILEQLKKILKITG